ncbi:molybdopterin-dependent oxidoreductase, partial [candidate division KSB1 bacterium]
QKTEVSFLDDINKNVKGSELKLNRWGDIEAVADSLQTGVESIFAAGDSVTGPATLIEAIAQAKIASTSTHQFVMGLPIDPEKKEFLSKKENFKDQLPESYIGHFEKQLREEMPTLKPSNRMNFKEVELGYKNEEVAKHEALRCLECGCSDYFTCDLKKYSTEYGAEQEVYKGDFNEYEVDFRHPFIEIDNNKCILCSRCIRICKEVVGANALGLVNRGFDAYVAPSMGNSLQDTTCESCGVCLSTCPTGALMENVIFKPGPVKHDDAETICNYCSIGCKIAFKHKNGFVMQTVGEKGVVNTNGNICRYPKFGYDYLNDPERLTKPLLKVNGRFEKISFKQAYEIIIKRIKAVDPNDNVFFAGARLSNEELYLIQKLARLGVKTNNVTSFHYLNRGNGYIYDSSYNVPFDQLSETSKIYLVGSEINLDNAVLGFKINNVQKKLGVKLELVTNQSESPMSHKVDRMITIRSYYYFIKAVNYYLIANSFENQLFIKDTCEGFEEYKKHILQENFVELVEKSGVKIMDTIIEFAKDYNREINAIIVFSEKEICSNTANELFNLAMITGKLGKTASGLISLKEKNNSQGIFDMGICPKLGVGGQPIKKKELVTAMKKIWHTNKLPISINESQYELLENGLPKNVFIFGEDPLGCADNKVKVAGWLAITDFVVVQDYFMTDTAQTANLVLPASFPAESGGSFTNTQRVIQEFEPVFQPKVERLSYQQLLDLLEHFKSNGMESVTDVMQEAISLLPTTSEKRKHQFHYTNDDSFCRMFDHGCDTINKRFDEEFQKTLTKS